MARARKPRKVSVSPVTRAMMTLRKSDAGKADYVVVFRLRTNPEGVIEVVDSDYAHWTDEASDDPPPGLFEAVAKWVRQRHFAAWGEDVGTRAVQLAVSKGMEALFGPKPDGG